MSELIHPTAVVHPSVRLGEGVVIGPYSIVEEGAVIGDGTVLDAHVIVGKHTKLGRNNRLFPNCVLGKNPQILGTDENTPFSGLQIGDQLLDQIDDVPPDNPVVVHDHDAFVSILRNR